MDKYHPTSLGFDEFTGFREGGVKTINPTLEKQGKLSKFSGLTADVLTDEAIQFVNKHKDQKFALSLHYRAPHTSWLPVSEADAEPYKNFKFKIPNPDYPDLDAKRVQNMMRKYLSSVRSIDRNLGRFMRQLDELGLTNNTLVVFISDHGYNMGHNGIWHKGNGNWILKTPTHGTKNIPANRRPNLYDNSLKVPLIVRWPGVVEAGVINQSIVSNLDWFPTLVEIGEGQLDDKTIIRGDSIVPFLQGKSPVKKQYYYAAYSTLHQSITAMRSISDGEYKLVKDFKNKKRDEFYVLKTDPAEQNNQIEAQDPKLKQIIKQLEIHMLKKMQATNDPMLP